MSLAEYERVRHKVNRANVQSHRTLLKSLVKCDTLVSPLNTLPDEPAPENEALTTIASQ